MRAHWFDRVNGQRLRATGRLRAVVHREMAGTAMSRALRNMDGSRAVRAGDAAAMGAAAWCG